MYCPTCAMHEEWVGAVAAAFAGLQAGLALTDVAPEPTQALVDGVTLMAAEVDQRNAQRQRDRSPR